MGKTKELKTVEVGGKTYAVGLFWMPVQNEKSVLKEVKTTINTVDTTANLYCLRRGTSSQYGLASTYAGHKAGMPSGAAGIASALRDKSSAVCVMKVKQGWWFVTIRNNLILTEEDTVYTDEREAQEAFRSMLSIPDWGYKIAPAEWGIEDTKEISAEDLLKKGFATELKPVNDNTKQIIFLLVLVVTAGYWYWDKKQKEAEEARLNEIRRQEQLRMQQQEAERKKITPPPPAPWTTIINPEDIAKKCTILIVNSTATIPGWELENSDCKQNSLSVNWKRTYGSPGWIFEAKKFGYLPEKMVLSADDNSYKTASGNLSLPDMKTINSEPILTKFELQKKLNDLFHSLQVETLRLGDDKIEVKDPENPDYQRIYPYTTFEFSDGVFRLPLDWMNFLKEIKGLELQSIYWNNKDKTWTYKGRIFEYTDEIEKEKEEAKKREEEIARLASENGNSETQKTNEENVNETQN